MAGGFVLVVGPSGAGKDTLLDLTRSELCGDKRFCFPRRLITRLPSVWEDHDTITEAEFEAGVAEGQFALAWRAHGLGYALPASTLAAARSGCIVICNISRTRIIEARDRLPAVAVVEITAPVEVLARRLARRARNEDSDVAMRLFRSSEIGAVNSDLTIVNDCSPEKGARQLIQFLRLRADATPG